MPTTSKDGFCDKSDAEILNSLKDWALPDVDFKRERSILVLLLCGVAVTAVDPEVF